MTIWRPETEAELLAALESGDARENHYLDFKREIGDTDSSRRETAADIASFAIHGGILIVGVDEPESGRFSLAPIDLTGASERVEQIAANRPDPGIGIRTFEVPAAANDGTGYLVIEIPPSPAAPHMVAGRYWARSEKTKRQMNDAEVVQMHANREALDDRVHDALDEELDRETIPKPESRMFLVAVPLAAPANVARTFTAGEAYEVVNFARGGTADLPPSVRQWAPGPEYLTTHERRSRGIASTSLDAGRKHRGGIDVADNDHDVEVQASGSIRIMISGTTTHHARPNGVAFQGIRDGTIIGWAHRLVRLSVDLSERIGYHGAWGFGVLVYGLSGLRSLLQVDLMHLLPVFEEDAYREVTTATLGEMQATPNAIVSRLVADLALALGVENMYSDALEAIEGTEDTEA